METLLPIAIQPLIQAYTKALAPLQARFFGIYIYGSIALAAFEETQSDIDMVALTQGEWTASELAQLENIHKALNQEYSLGKRLEVIYVPFSGLGKYNDTLAPYPCVRDGKFLVEGKGDLNAVTWWLVQHKGIRVLGPERATLPLAVDWQEVLKTMDYNLNGYWAGKSRKQPYLFLTDYWVVFAVSTLCRILSALEEGEIIAKSPALQYWRRKLPTRFQLLVDETWRIRHRSQKSSLYRFRLSRMNETLAFIRYMRERAGNGN